MENMVVVLGWWLDLMELKIFSSLNDLIIQWLYVHLKNQVTKTAMCASTVSIISYFFPKIKSRFMLSNESTLSFSDNAYQVVKNPFSPSDFYA